MGRVKTSSTARKRAQRNTPAKGLLYITLQHGAHGRALQESSMMQWIKIAGLSAILAAGVVTAFGSTGQAAITSGKISYDRLPASSDMPEVRSEARALVGASGAPRSDFASGK